MQRSPYGFVFGRLPFLRQPRWVRASAAKSPRACATPAKLLGPDSLSSLLSSDAPPVVLDVRGRVSKVSGRVESGFQPTEYIADDNAYFACHIPSASFIDWRSIDVHDHLELCDLFSSLGVERERMVCVYDWGDMLFASRVWFALLCMGCLNVAILNGGWSAWDAFEGPVSIDTNCPLKNYSDMESVLAEDEHPEQSALLPAMRSVVESKMSATDLDTVIIDARSRKQFCGIEQRSKRAGHIPTAINVPYRRLLNDSAVGLRNDEELRKVFTELSNPVFNASRVFSYCNGGVASTLVAFALVRCGLPWERIVNYCGSFSEWGNLEDTPIQV